MLLDFWGHYDQVITRRFQFFSMDQFHHHALPCLFHQLHYLIFDIAKPRLLQQRIVTSVPLQRCTAWPFRLRSHCKFRTYVSELGQYLSSMTVALVWFEVGRRGGEKKNQVTYGQKVANLGHVSLQSDCSLRGTVDKHLQREVGHVLSNKLQSACWKSRRGGGGVKRVGRIPESLWRRRVHKLTGEKQAPTKNTLVFFLLNTEQKIWNSNT